MGKHIKQIQVPDSLRLTVAEKTAIKLGKAAVIIGYFGKKGYGDYNGKFISPIVMKKLVDKGIFEHPEFSSAHTLTDLGHAVITKFNLAE